MNIYLIDVETQQVRVEFTEDELNHEKFQQSSNGIFNKYNGVMEDNQMVLTPKKAQRKDNIAVLVDDIREKLMCDVLPLSDPKKDLSKCPLFKFTAHTVQELKNEPLDVLKVEGKR